MLVSDTQIATLGAPAREEFIRKSIQFLKENTPRWVAARPEEEIRALVERMIELAIERNVKKEINIQKLLYNSITYNLELPFSKALELQLAQATFGEDYRIKNFIKQIVKYGIR